ncbi:hypothetical protein T09_13660 [Trichinella sp. T9]|nr:hypothetical protein T09_13660 [Trichinella sp. T9]
MHSHVLLFVTVKNRSRVLYAHDTQVQFARRSIVRQMRVDCMMWILLDQPSTGTAVSSTNFDSFTDVPSSYVFSHGIYRAQPPVGGSIKADNLAIFVGNPNHH